MAVRIHEKPREADFFSVCNACHHSACCQETRPPLTEKRMRIIANFLKENHVHIEIPFQKKQYAFPGETPDGRCIFFDSFTRRCRIHPVKPETCVAGPFTFDINRETQKIEWFLKKDSICPLAGLLHQDLEAQRKHMKSARRELLRLVRELEAEALRAVLTVDEPETFKVGEENALPSVLTKLKK